MGWRPWTRIEPVSNEVDELYRAWLRIEAWLQRFAPELAAILLPGASEAEVAALQTACGSEVPPDLVRSLIHHGGQKLGAPGLFFGARYLGPGEIEAELRVWWSLADRGELVGAGDSTGRVRQSGWERGWLPFTSSASGDHYCIDMCPGGAGEIGQVIYFQCEVPEVQWSAGSLTDWLSHYADLLETGAIHNVPGWGLVPSDLS